jgi:ectoine hydroxylase-related dioxygenase (phytanoyl-CoA dioxygenase family)
MSNRQLNRHDLNTAFSWVDHEGPYAVITDAQAKSYDELGYFVLPNAFSSEEIDAVVAEIDPMEARQEAELRKQKDGKYFIARADEITFTTHLVTQSAALRQFTRSKLFAGLCADLIGPDARLYWDQAVYKKPDTDAPFPWHQDNGYAFVEPQQYLTCWVALTDATEDNGCPWVVPGVHRMGTLSHRYSDIGFVCLTDPDGAMAAPVERGGIVVFSSLTPHSTGPNLTDQVRKAYIVQFAPDGAYVIQDDGRGGQRHFTADDAQRQFPVVIGGRPAPAD